MKIAVIGWFNRQNIGDERILQCLKWFFNKHEVHPFNMENAKKKIDKINSCDYVLLGGGGLLLRGFNRYYGLFNGISRPLGCVGIGVEAMNKDMKKTINLLLEKSNFILVRDKESRELLGNHYKTIVGPDLTFLSNYDLFDPVDEKIVGLNLRTWYPWRVEFGSFSLRQLDRLKKNFARAHLSFEKIWPFRKWDERKFVNLLREFEGEIFPMPFYFEKGNSDVDVLRQYFDGVPNTFDINWFRKIRYLVAMRFHAILVSVQCGIPFVCISYQPKCTRFCQSIGMNHYCLDVSSGYNKIVDRLFDLENNYETIRQNLILHRQKLSSDINHVMNEILTLMESQVELNANR
jgi:polysaccharide pyruvyl transferase WcaK-like protein